MAQLTALSPARSVAVGSTRHRKRWFAPTFVSRGTGIATLMRLTMSSIRFPLSFFCTRNSSSCLHAAAFTDAIPSPVALLIGITCVWRSLATDSISVRSASASESYFRCHHGTSHHTADTSRDTHTALPARGAQKL